MSRQFERAMLAGVLMVGVVLGWAGPAGATSVSCSSTNAVGYASCTTSNLGANTQYHFIHLATGPGGDYNLVDGRNGVLVAAGNGGWGGANRTVYGLYSYYHLIVSAPLVAYGTIQNT